MCGCAAVLACWLLSCPVVAGAAKPGGGCIAQCWAGAFCSYKIKLIIIISMLNIIDIVYTYRTHNNLFSQ